MTKNIRKRTKKTCKMTKKTRKMTFALILREFLLPMSGYISSISSTDKFRSDRSKLITTNTQQYSTSACKQVFGISDFTILYINDKLTKIYSICQS